jgi:DNA-binding IclR family transcriptional regulator
MSMVDLYPVDEAVIEQLADECQSVPARLAEQTGYDRQYVQKRLKRLTELGYVENLNHGLYRLTDDPREATND